MPTFWGYPHGLMITHTIESCWIKVKKKIKVTNLKNLLKFKILQFWNNLYIDKMCKYKMDPTSIVEDTQRTRFCPQLDRPTDGQGETSIPPLQLRWSWEYDNNV